jgi:hypothetical protein
MFRLHNTAPGPFQEHVNRGGFSTWLHTRSDIGKMRELDIELDDALSKCLTEITVVKALATSGGRAVSSSWTTEI